MKTRRWVVVALAAIAGAWASGSARAEDPGRFGQSGQVVLSVERLTGFLHVEQESRSTATNEVYLLASPLGAIGAYTWPRVGFDGFVIDGLSVGIAASYTHVAQGNSTADLLQAAPRVGYAAPLSPSVAIWPRAGLTFTESLGDGDVDESLLALTLEVPFALQIAPHAAILVGPTLDLGIAATHRKVTELGASAGLGLVL